MLMPLDSWPSASAGTCAPRFTVDAASAAERDRIHAVRHAVYAVELGQHATNEAGRLRDALDEYNVNLVVRVHGTMAGFISITPPGRGAFSIDKYFARDALSFKLDDDTFEVRLLTVLPEHRGREIALLLMHAALRWVEAHGGSRIVAIGRREVLDLYLRVGLARTGDVTRAGNVTYDLLTATVDEIRGATIDLAPALKRVERDTVWRLPLSFRRPAPCFHGGAFFKAVGERFDRLGRHRGIINADVLDAWFPPAPGVVASLREELPWLLRTSPPTGCEGLIETIAEARGVAPRHILPGAGSSDLIFRALRQWLTPASKVLILDPTYGEYAHVLERVIGCRVDRFELCRSSHYAADPAALASAMNWRYDLVILVNPNSPTGQHLPRHILEMLLAGVPAATRIWIDETYVDYAGADQSLERFAARSENVIVCKSMSKVYALSGARVAYLCAGAHQLEALRAITPPWVVGLPSQLAAVRALQDPGYYAARHAETHTLRTRLAADLETLGWEVAPGMANFLLCHLPPSGPGAATIVARTRAAGVFVRDAATMSARLGTHCVRVAVKSAVDNRRIAAALHEAMTGAPENGALDFARRPMEAAAAAGVSVES